ncbi:MAG: hypothetical protein RIR18_648 [Pseudomonadota bacterium]
MKTQQLKISLLSPAFLGDASQSGVWRTPPIKALLREWWRISAAPSFNYGHKTMREAEGLLFGNAWLDDKFCKSQVRIALEHWHAGKPGWETNDPKVTHPEVKFPVGSQLYLGYGPLIFQQGSAKLKNNAALQAGETNNLDLAYPDAEQAVIQQTLNLIDWFGTIGGRSRNAWGSLSIGQKGLTSDHPHLSTVQRDLKACLTLDWPHAIGKDIKGALVWESHKSFADWQEAMKFLAQTKIGFRTQLGFSTGKGSPQVEARHIVAYPVTNHDVRAWGGQARLANQLRFKLFRDTAGQLRARIYHTPHNCPLPSGMSEGQELAVWQQIHIWLDQQGNLQRLGAAQ